MKKLIASRDLLEDLIQSKLTINAISEEDLAISIKDPNNTQSPTAQFCTKAPLLWDFTINLLNEAIESNTIEDTAKDYYEAAYQVGRLSNYISKINNIEKRYRTKKTLVKDLFFQPPKLVFRNSKGFWELGWPIICNLADENNEKTSHWEKALTMKVMFQKGVFRQMVERKWEGSRGYVKIPANLYPLIKNIEGETISRIQDNSHYKLQILSTIKHYKGHTSSKIDKNTFKKVILPEFYREKQKKGVRYIEYIKINPLQFDEKTKEIMDQYNFFSEKVKGIHDYLCEMDYDGPILRNLYIDKENVTLHYTTERNNHIHNPCHQRPY